MSCSPQAIGAGHPAAPAAEFTPLDAPFVCAPLHATVPARCCLARQAANGKTTTRQASRGQGYLFPSCVRCPQGLALRAALDPEGRVRWRGAQSTNWSAVRRKVRIEERAG